MIGEVRKIDTVHETRTHGASTPRPWDETCARYADSWGMSMASNNLLTGEDPYKIAERAFAFDWSRVDWKRRTLVERGDLLRHGAGGVTWKKQTDPRELTTLLWMTLAHGAAGAMFLAVQARPRGVRVARLQPCGIGRQADAAPGGGIRSDLPNQRSLGTPAAARPEGQDRYRQPPGIARPL